MTISSAISQTLTPCNGTTTNFAFLNKIFQAADLVVTLIDTAGVLYAFILSGTNTYTNASTGLSYTVFNIDVDGGCFIVFSGAPTNGWSLDMRTSIAELQSTSIKNQGGYLPELHEEFFDKATRMLQDLYRKTYTFGIHGPDIESAAWAPLPSAINRALKYAAFDSNGLPIVTAGLPSGAITPASIGAVLYATTIAEQLAITASAGVLSIVNGYYPYNNVLRYGITPNNTTPAVVASNLAIARALFNPAVPNGPSGQFTFPNTTGADVYTFGGVIACRDGVHLDLGDCAVNMGSAGTPVAGVAADTNCGFFMALHDFECKNGNITVWWNTTGASTSSGNAFWFGGRDVGTYWTIFDSLLAVPLGNYRLSNLRISMNVTGANANGTYGVAMAGGINGAILEDLFFTGTGTGGAAGAINYEFGWATTGSVGDTGQSSRQTSHAHNLFLNNIVVNNFDASTGNGIILTGAYNVFMDGIYIAGSATSITCNPGEAMYFRPWVGVDDFTRRHHIAMRNIACNGFSNAGVLIEGRVPMGVNTTYLQHAWVALTAVVLNQTVVNGGNMYQCTVAGTTGNTGGPAGTGGAIVEGSVTWAYVDFRARTDLISFTIEGYSLNGTAASAGILSYAGYAGIKNGATRVCAQGIVISEETTHFDIDGHDGQLANGVGIFADFTASQIWPVARLKKGTIRNSYIAGSSAGSAGAFGAIQIKNFNGVLIENVQFGYESADSFIQETTQAQAVLISSSTAGANANLLVRNCRIGGSVGGVGLVNNSASVNQGCRAENNTYNAGGTNPVTTPLQGAWLADLESATAVAIVNGNTITTNGLATTRVNPAGAVTGIVLQQGSYQGQKIFVSNEAAGANTVTFAIAGTSHVADGASSAIAGLTGRLFQWDVGTGAWVRAA